MHCWLGDFQQATFLLNSVIHLHKTLDLKAEWVLMFGFKYGDSMKK